MTTARYANTATPANGMTSEGSTIENRPTVMTLTPRIVAANSHQWANTRATSSAVPSDWRVAARSAVSPGTARPSAKPASTSPYISRFTTR